MPGGKGPLAHCDRTEPRIIVADGDGDADGAMDWARVDEALWLRDCDRDADGVMDRVRVDELEALRLADGDGGRACTLTKLDDTKLFVSSIDSVTM